MEDPSVIWLVVSCTSLFKHATILYLTVRLSGYTNAPTEPAFLALGQDMEYLMHHPHEPIMYSRKEKFRIHEIPY